MKNDHMLQIRMPTDLKNAFTEECNAQYRTPSDVLRELIRDWLYRNGDGELAKKWKRRPGATQ